MVHAVSHLASRGQSLTPPVTAASTVPKVQPKSSTPSFANSLKSLFGAPAASHSSTPPPATTPAELVPTPPPDTSLKALFGQPVTAINPDPPRPQAPTAESVFGANPWMAAPVCQGPNGVTFSYNPIFFATQATAQKVAQMVGGTVTQSNQFTPNGGPFQQQQANWMVQLPNGNQINPGLLASFYTHGYPQSYIDGLIAGYVNNG